MNTEELKRMHEAWLIYPNTSRGQIDDSKTILGLIARIKELESLLRCAEKALWGTLLGRQITEALAAKKEDDK